MSKLISTYSTATGLRIDKPDLPEAFYPLPFTDYVTIQTGSGQGPKNYDYYQEVIVMLMPTLAARAVAIVHLGAKDDPPLQGVHDLRGKTSVAQSQYILKRGKLHLGNDSWLAHCAGWNRHPLVALYGSTSAQNHGPYWSDPARTRLLSSHRAGGVPTYSSQEQPKAINWIAPETVANAVIDLLTGDPAARLVQETRFIGLLYTHPIFEVVPDSFPDANSLPGQPFIVRMDYRFDEAVLENLLRTGRKVSIFTNREINLNLLAQYRPSILGYTHELDISCPLQYVASLKAILPQHLFHTREKDPAKVAALRFQFFDLCTIEQTSNTTRDDYLTAALGYLNWDESKRVDLETELRENRVLFKSNKYLMSKGQLYLSPAHLRLNQPISDFGQNVGTMIDASDCFRDVNHHLVYSLPPTP